jgi:hypothetical protein
LRFHKSFEFFRFRESITKKFTKRRMISFKGGHYPHRQIHRFRAQHARTANFRTLFWEIQEILLQNYFFNFPKLVILQKYINLWEITKNVITNLFLWFPKEVLCKISKPWCSVLWTGKTTLIYLWLCVKKKLRKFKDKLRTDLQVYASHKCFSW